MPLIAAIAVLASAGCSGGGGSSAGGAVKTDGTLSLALPGDPGSLNPHAPSQSGSLGQMTRFLYDPLVNDLNGKVVSGLATSWVEHGRKIVFTLHDGITCADGSPLTATDVADNLNYVGDKKNADPFGDYAIPLGTTAVADNKSNTVTMTTPKVTGFLLNTLPSLPIVCASGLANMDSLRKTPDGTGPYTLTGSVAGSSYTLERRNGYTWGPDGQTTATPGIPKTIDVTIGANETTTANQLLGNQLDIGTVFGADVPRLHKAGLYSTDLPAVAGQLFWNEAKGRATADPAIRHALTQALDLATLRKVIGGGTATPSKAFTGLNLCGSDLSKIEPTQDVAAAKSALAGHHLGTLTVDYLSFLGPAGSAAAELVVNELKAVGVQAKAVQVSDVDIESKIFSDADFDLAMYPMDGPTPLSVQSTFSGTPSVDGGQNFASIDDATYNRLSDQAASMPGTEGCDLWNQADDALVSSSNAIPFASSHYYVWGSDATFSTYFGTVLPTTIRQHG